MKAALIGILLFSLGSLSLAQQETNAASTESTEQIIGEDRYISDQLLVPLRSGTSSQHRIVHKGLKSGSAVTMLKEDKDNGWSLVRTSRGVEGWLRSQYLFSEPTASVKLKRAQQTIQQLSSKAGPLSEKLITAEKNNRSSKKDIKNLQREKNMLSKELDRVKNLSSNVIALDEENKNLLQDNETLKHERDKLKAENTRLSDQLKSDDFMYGAYAIILGIIATLVIQHFARSRRDTDWH